MNENEKKELIEKLGLDIKHFEKKDIIILKIPNAITNDLYLNFIRSIMDEIEKITGCKVLAAPYGGVNISTVSEEAAETKRIVLKTLDEWKDKTDVLSINTVIKLIEENF